MVNPCPIYTPPWWHGHLPPGVSIAILAGVSLLVPWFRGEVRGREKAIWNFIMLMLVFSEIWAIRMDRIQSDHDSAHEICEARVHFGDIRDGIKKSLNLSEQHFTESMQSAQATLEQIQQASKTATTAVNTLTGGNGYLYFNVSSVMGPIGLDLPPMQKGEVLANAFPYLAGKYPLHNVFVAVVGPRGWMPSANYGTIFPHETGRPRQGILLHCFPDKPIQKFVLYINTSNGSYAQIVLFLKVGTRWLAASRLYRVGVKRPIRSWADPNLPHSLVRKAWSN